MNNGFRNQSKPFNFDFLKGLFKQPTTSNAKYRSPDFYQVKPTDKSLADVSSQVGVPLSSLVEFNQNAKTLPPVGSYISLTPNGNIPASTIPTVGSGLPPALTTYPGQIPSYVGMSKTQTPIGPVGSDKWYNDPNFGIAETIKAIQNSPTMPNQVPNAALSSLSINGQPVTPQQMTSLGYTLDTNTGTWKNGSAAQNQSNKPVYMQDVNYNGQVMPAWRAEMLANRAAGISNRQLSYKEQRQRQIRNKAQRERDAALQARLKAARRVVNPAEAGNAADTNATTLELRLGSG